MKDVLCTLISFLSFHGVKTKNVNLKTNEQGQVESCSGSFTWDTVIPNSKHRKLLAREFEEMAKKDFRFYGRKITITEDSFTIEEKVAETV